MVDLRMVDNVRHRHPCNCDRCAACTCRVCVRSIYRNFRGQFRPSPPLDLCGCDLREPADRNYMCSLCGATVSHCAGQGTRQCDRCNAPFNVAGSVCRVPPVPPEEQGGVAGVGNETTANHPAEQPGPPGPPDGGPPGGGGGEAGGQAVVPPTPDGNRAGAGDPDGEPEPAGEDGAGVGDGEGRSGWGVSILNAVSHIAFYGGVAAIAASAVQSFQQPRMRLFAALGVAGYVAASRIYAAYNYDPVIEPVVSEEASDEMDLNLYAFLSERASHERRTAELPKYLRKQAESWRRQHKTGDNGWTDYQFLEQYTMCLGRVLAPGMADLKYAEFLRRNADKRGVLAVQAFNGMVAGNHPQYDFVCRLARTVGFSHWADKRAIENGIAVLPAK